tara:strand:+ start:1109 stop:1702 length:594 start_codon:yes stop_codon:yes gene_type:complete
MILVNPEYLPSVNYFRLFKDNNIVLDYEGKYNNQSQLTRTWIFGNDNVFPLEIPIKRKSKKKLIKDLQIDYSKNWINKHFQSIQSSYGKYPYYIYYKDLILDKIKVRHNFLIDLNYDLLTLFIKLLNFKNKIVESDAINLKNNNYRAEEMYNDKLFNKNVKEYRKNLFLGKKFDYKLSVIDLLFVKGPESGFFINNF